jgi:nitrite reductase/ring-hydroxylating ferredoxin subunit
MSEGQMMHWIDAAGETDVADGEALAVSLNGIPIALIRDGDEIFALHDLCTHGAARLSDGFVEDGCIECPLHQGRFDLASGEPRCAPVNRAVKTYPVRRAGARVEVGLTSDPG